MGGKLLMSFSGMILSLIGMPIDPLLTELICNVSLTWESIYAERSFDTAKCSQGIIWQWSVKINSLPDRVLTSIWGYAIIKEKGFFNGLNRIAAARSAMYYSGSYTDPAVRMRVRLSWKGQIPVVNGVLSILLIRSPMTALRFLILHGWAMALLSRLCHRSLIHFP